ncbi:hypothetical protein C8Q80DRAFT_1170895 [Daedaleopsis nitida]|nr:hypothetical protein C8Q80DRAFT_1170895 [Daedaleopsis nitida]
MPILPAHETKHIPLLVYPFGPAHFHLAQRDNGVTNGTGLWLGAQCLSLYLAESLKNKSQSPGTSAGGNRPRAIELGSGIGLSALVLASMGWDVIATDLQDTISAVLASNISRNRSQLPPNSGAIEVRVLDWTVSPDHWVWDDLNTIASPHVEKASCMAHQSSILGPPFDLIISSDTLYSAELVTPLLRALRELCNVSISSSPEVRPPPIYLAIERRDPEFIDRALSEATNFWDFKVERVPHKKVAKAMEKGGVCWERGAWDGVEVWKLSIHPSTTVRV